MTVTKEPFSGYKFRVDIGGIPFGGYDYVSGLGIDLDIEEVQEGGRNESTIKLIGYGKPRPITLRRGLTDAKQLQDWIAEVINGLNTGENKFRKPVSIVQLDTEGNDARIFSVQNAFPDHHSVGPWDSLKSQFTEEEISIYHDGDM